MLVRLLLFLGFVVFFASPETQTTDWLNISCKTHRRTCGRNNNLCRKLKCTCLPGYYYSESEKTCVTSCSAEDLQHGNYTDYPGARIAYEFYKKQNYWNWDEAHKCGEICTEDPKCRAYSMKKGRKIRCVFHDKTAREVNAGGFENKAAHWTYYQKMCA